MIAFIINMAEHSPFNERHGISQGKKPLAFTAMKSCCIRKLRIHQAGVNQNSQNRKERIMKKKYLAALLAASLSVMTAACGSTGTQNISSSAESTDQAGSEGSKENGKADSDTETENAVESSSTEENADSREKENTSDDSTEEVNTAGSSLASSDSSIRMRRYLPESSEDQSDTEDTKSDKIFPSSAAEVKTPDKITGNSIMFVVKNDTPDETAATKKSGFPGTESELDGVLQDLATYFAANDANAYDYLCRSEKMRYISGLLSNSNDYFYSGEENAQGEPNGTGIAVYADNTYYYGGFENGLRSGKGIWYRIFIKNGNYSKANNGILAHSYNGNFAEDYPEGSGQEHLDIDEKYLTERIATNVIGSFKSGYYDGEEHITTLDQNGQQEDWDGRAILGTWVPVNNNSLTNDKGKTEVAVAENTNTQQNYIWMLDEENRGQGITGIMPRQ